MLKKIEKEIGRFTNKLFCSGKKHKQLEEIQNELKNMPYEIYDRIASDSLCVQIPTIKSVDETLDKILQANCSLSRFGDGEFSVMNGSRIHFQDPCPELAERLKAVIASEASNLLIGLPDHVLADQRADAGAHQGARCVVH